MMYCERCNIDFTEGLRYCKWCGQTLIERRRDTSELQACPNCSAVVQPKWAFCKVCGVKLTSAVREPLTRACPQCGTPANPGALHCLNCGQHLQAGDEAAAGEAPSTSIIALCPTCGERIDPGSVYCKGCGAALYEQPAQHAFGANQSAIICTACQSFNPVGSTTCRVCGASLIVTSGITGDDHRATQVVTGKDSNTLPDLADHLEFKPSGEHRQPTGERASQPPSTTQERVSPPVEFDSGAYTLTFESPGTEAFQSSGTEGFHNAPPPTPPTHTKGGDTSVLPGVAGSKFEQPPPTAALHMNRDTGPVEGEELAPVAEEPLPADTVSPSSELRQPAAPVTRLDTEGISGRATPPPSHETFTFVSDVESAGPEGTVALGANTTPPAAFESDARPPASPFVLPDAPAPPPQKPTAPVPASETDRIVNDPTQVIANVASPTEVIADPRRVDAPPATMPIEHAAQAPFVQSNAGYPVAQTTVAAPPVTPKKGRAGLFIGIIATLFLLGLVGGAAWWFLSGRNVTKPTATAPPVETPVEIPKPPETSPPPTQAAPEGMVMVAAGNYLVGRDDGSDLEKPQHAVTLPAYYIDRTEVTNEAYKKFVDETNHKPPVNWQGKDYPAGRANYPVTGVTWQDAMDYAAWAGKRLPTEIEWEAAARGPQGLRYPWGNEWLSGQANIGVKAGQQAKDNEYPPQIMEVGGYPQGASPVGALDMIGNVWEWTADELNVYPGNSATFAEVAKKLDFKLSPGVTYRVIRGGAFDGSEIHNASYRGGVDASHAFPKTGFRCVKDMK